MISKSQYLFLKRLFPVILSVPVVEREEAIHQYVDSEGGKMWVVLRGSVTHGFSYKRPGSNRYVKVPKGFGPGVVKSCINDGLIAAKSVQTIWLSPSLPVGYPNRWEHGGRLRKAIENELSIKMADSVETHICLLKKGKDEFFEYERQLRQAK